MQKTRSKTLFPVAVGAQPHLVPEEETVRIAASSDEETDEHSILVLALEHAFGSDGNRIIYETDSLGCTEHQTGILKPVGSGLSAALGFIGARNRLHQNHNVVLAADMTSVEPILQQLDRRGPQDLGRCVLLLPVSFDGFARDNGAVLERFRARGGHLLDLTSARNVVDLARGFKSAAERPAACLVAIDSTIVPFWQGRVKPEISRRRTSHRQSVADRILLTSVAREIARFVRDDHRATPVLFDSQPQWQKLVEEFEKRVLVPGGDDVGEALVWCTALAEGGCHPIIVLNVGQFSDHAAALQDIFQLKQRVTVVVLDPSTSSVDAITPALAPFFSAVPVAMPGTPDEVVPLMKIALRADGVHVLYLPVGSELFHHERDGWLDFRAAAPLREGCRTKRHTGALPLMLGSPERENRQILHHPLSPGARRWIEEYDRVGQRGLYLWRWAAHAIRLLELPCIDPDWRHRNRDTKLLAAMFNVLLDDVADQRQNGGLLHQLMRLPRGGRPEIEDSDPAADYARLTGAVWEEIWRRAGEYPQFHEYADLLHYDFWQLCNTIEYSDLVLRQPEMINSVEHALYTPHGMMVTCAATMDLMCSPRFDVSELGLLREALWHAACMARYGNLLTTWRREIDRGDFTSGVFTKAVENGWLTRRELGHMNQEQVEQRVSFAAIEREFLNRWQIHRACVLQMRDRVCSCALRSYVEGLDRLLLSEYASIGRK